MRIAKNITLPTGWRKLAFKAPIVLYHAGVGCVFGHRLLLLRHRGRVSGKWRDVVLEVVEHDGNSDSFVVASGWGDKASWYRNILETPEAMVKVGRRTLTVTALPLTKDEGAEIFVRYAQLRPGVATRVLPRVLGYEVDGSQTDFYAVGLRMPFVRLVPRH